MQVKQTKQPLKTVTKTISLNWEDNPNIKELLDVISFILTEEYMQIAKENKNVFEIASPPPADRNDESNQGGLK
jgi:hypothetical protein